MRSTHAAGATRRLVASFSAMLLPDFCAPGIPSHDRSSVEFGNRAHPSGGHISYVRLEPGKLCEPGAEIPLRDCADAALRVTSPGTLFRGLEVWNSSTMVEKGLGLAPPG